MTFVVGLTGGIGSGKSAAADRFAALGAGIVDTDVIAHRLTAPDGPAIPAILNTFGKHAITADGALDRAAMRQRVFADPAARRQLEAILHPLIRTESETAIRHAAATGVPYVILVVPLLIESNTYRERVSRVCVVDCPEALQITRTMSRSGVSRETVTAMMSAQVSRAARLAAADDTIDNSGTLDKLYPQVEKLHQNYLRMSGNG